MIMIRNPIVCVKHLIKPENQNLSNACKFRVFLKLKLNIYGYLKDPIIIALRHNLYFFL